MRRQPLALEEEPTMVLCNPGHEAVATTADGLEARMFTMKTNEVVAPKAPPHRFDVYDQTTECNL